MTAFQERDPLPDARSGCQGGVGKGRQTTGEEGKSVQVRPGRQRKMSGAPTPTGVCLDYSHQEFADDQHGEGLIHTFRHSNVGSPAVQYGAANTGAQRRRIPVFLTKNAKNFASVSLPT